MDADAQKRKRDIKIKTGVVKRLAKEKLYYEKESNTERDKVEKMKAEGKDEHDIRKQEEVWSESKMMIPDCVRKLGSAYDELVKMLEAESETELKESEEYAAAKQILDESKETANR